MLYLSRVLQIDLINAALMDFAHVERDVLEVAAHHRRIVGASLHHDWPHSVVHSLLLLLLVNIIKGNASQSGILVAMHLVLL